LFVQFIIIIRKKKKKKEVVKNKVLMLSWRFNEQNRLTLLYGKYFLTDSTQQNNFSICKYSFLVGYVNFLRIIFLKNEHFKILVFGLMVLNLLYINICYYYKD
jgi:hypothetical protein